jgi:putative flippase GtrA
VPAAFARFAASNGLVSLAGNLLLMQLLVGTAGLPILAANLLAIGACGLLNFWLADRLVFASRPSQPRPARRPTCA